MSGTFHSRDPMWFCHECHAEMRPLMTPEPICASCRGSFVEQIEDTSDDPREYQRTHAMGLNPEELPPGIDNFLTTLQGLMAAGSVERNNDNQRSTGNGFSFQIGGPSQNRTIIVGGPTATAPRNRDVPTMSQFVRRREDGTEQDGITGPIMAHYLMSLLGHGDPLSQMLGGGHEGGPAGQMGDYVFNQEALDQVITQLMDNSSGSHPVPATPEIMEGLPREVLEEGSPTLAKECAVCKDPFTLETEDPDEQVVLSLPCKHVFHEGCILPWLKSSGTCPVCRYALIPQPEHSGPNASGNPRPPAQGGNSSGAGGFLSSLFGMVGAGNNTSSTNSATGNGNGNTEDHSSRTQQSSNSRSNNERVPGSWDEQLD